FTVASFWSGEIALASQHLDAMIARYNSTEHPEFVFCYGEDPHIQPAFYRVWLLWFLGYPDQAHLQHQAAMRQAQAVASPHNLAFALNFSAYFYQFCRETSQVQTQVKAEISLSSKQGFPHWMGTGAILQGWARTIQESDEAGIAEIQRGLSVYQATGAQVGMTYLRALLAEAYGHMGEGEAGRQVLAEALADMESRGERFCEAELYRLDGDLLLMQDDSRVQEAEAV
ncbi:hypothetical protein C2W62_48900, partial [Candidatus Entotheonella serta]